MQIFQRRKGFIKTKSKFVDIMCHINPYHKKKMRYKNGQRVLYILELRRIGSAMVHIIFRKNNGERF